MAHFIGYVQGDRGPVSRLGSKKNGLNVKAHGHDFGVNVMLKYDEESDSDQGFVYATAGSGGHGRFDLIAILCGLHQDKKFLVWDAEQKLLLCKICTAQKNLTKVSEVRR